MSDQTFAWAVSYATEEESTARVNEASFGDGYTQGVADGINSLAQTWSLNFTYRREAETRAIRDFLTEHGGYDPFWWVSVIDGTAVRVVCKTWRTRHAGPGQYRLEMRFERRYDRDPDEYGDLEFEDFVQTLLVPSDTAILNPAAGDAAPGDPIPWGGLWLPYGGRIALEGDDGVSTPIELPPNTRFTGLIPRRLLVIGTDADAVVYGLSHPDVTALLPISGNRIVPVVPSDSVDLVSPAVGGIYTQSGGGLSYQSAAGAGSALLPPKRWLASPAITRVNAAGTDPEFTAVAFVQS